MGIYGISYLPQYFGIKSPLEDIEKEESFVCKSMNMNKKLI